ncbi:unnamed protein product [Thlaspi arvense]|uniref:PH domain-containing protein n=1 Tax=Thlaspi arvense TaxID=13288 RepID=A0AAU9SCB7_THLAR|nr:unnamed protein product [Thlaspi arvense]
MHEKLRKWNERWVILDPTTGKMEYKIRRNEPTIKGTIVFDENSTISISPVNFQGLPKYNGCCIYIGTPQKKDYFLCAETPGAARAWVTTLHATQLVLKAHKEAVDSLSGSGSATLGTVATVVAAANSTALECSKEIQAAMQVSLRTALKITANKPMDGPLDDLTIMKDLLAYVNMLQTQLQRQQLETKQVFEEKTESTNGETSLPMTKETEKDVDKACLSISRTASIPGENVVHMSEDQVVKAQPPVGESEWNDIQATEARVSDVREISAETERDRSNSLDISVVTPESNVPRNDLPPESSFHHQP